VSAETIYRSLFVQARGALRHELTRHLRTGRTRRRPRQRNTVPGIHDMVPISARPAEAADRAVPGHWEGDLLLGRPGKAAIGTLVERRTRYLLLLRLGHGRTAPDVRRALTRRIRTLPVHLRRSLTWDRGREMAEHVRFSVDTGVEVCFCDPSSPWQRGTNENTNGLLRQYFRKGADLSTKTQRQLDAVARKLNGRPRRTLDWKTPAEAFAEVVR
jgi:IS30 family transposase